MPPIYLYSIVLGHWNNLTFISSVLDANVLLSNSSPKHTQSTILLIEDALSIHFSQMKIYYLLFTSLYVRICQLMLCQHIFKIIILERLAQSGAGL
jgi:hypothetical protein